MTQSLPSQAASDAPRQSPGSSAPLPAVNPEATVGKISKLLSNLIQDQQLPYGSATATSASGIPRPQPSKFENELAIVRLGSATSLFYALRIKHPPTATHSVRVAIVCSAWCEALELEPELRDRIEVAALLHDVGKIGIPDEILKKPGRLTTEEQAITALSPQLSTEILRGSTDDAELLDMVRFSRAWYQGRRGEDAPNGEHLPLGARMLAIAEAFDSMTTDHVYRAAMSRERALAELSRYAGTQFDPRLTYSFHQLVDSRPEVLHGCVVQRWLKDLRAETSNAFWSDNAAESTSLTVSRSQGQGSSLEQYYHQLLVHSHEGVAFIDNEGIIRAWNAALYQLTGVKPAAMCGNRWDPALIGMRDDDDKPMAASECPIRKGLRHGSQSSHRLTLVGPSGNIQPVNVRVSGVTHPESGVQGVVVMFQDASHEEILERRVRDLNEQVARDPLTGVANRAEFDRMLEELCDHAARGEGGFSLVICDIDRFKSINDTYGHPAGDEAIVSFSRLLTSHCRDRDMVARYGGEEFVMLCPECDNATAARKADEVRHALELTTHACIDDQAFTASFGVTEFQAGDTADSVLARADRALLRAKDNGRNRVIQLGSGRFETTSAESDSAGQTRSGWFSWFDFSQPDTKKDVVLSTPVPLDLTIEKLKGFVADHHAEIIRVDDDTVEIHVTALFRSGGRRRSDQRVDFHLAIQFQEIPIAHQANVGGSTVAMQTLMHVVVKPLRGRDRRHKEVSQGATQLMKSLRSYLMADPIDQPKDNRASDYWAADQPTYEDG